jgi:hypothetical protein
MSITRVPLALSLCLALAGPRAQADELKYNSADTTETPAAVTAQPRPGLGGNSDAAATAELGAGSTLTTVGHAMAAGGLLLSVIGNSSQNGGLGIAGNIIYQIGIPLVGVGAGKVNRAAVKLNPGYVPDYRGWGWYWTAFAMGTIGGLTLQNVIKEANAADTEEEQEEALSKAGFPLILLLGSGVCAIVSWVKFGKLAGEGKRAALEAASMRDHGSLELMPTLAISADGRAEPGLHLGYRF